MKSFPKISGRQVAVLIAEVDTGYILDTELKLAIDDSQEVYRVFDSIQNATQVITGILKNRQDLEFLIYDSANIFLRVMKNDTSEPNEIS